MILSIKFWLLYLFSIESHKLDALAYFMHPLRGFLTYFYFLALFPFLLWERSD